MPHPLRRTTTGQIRPPRRKVRDAIDIPLLHPVKAAFTWGGRPCAIHASRFRPGSDRMHLEWFFLQLADGSYHEVQFSRLKQLLTCRPLVASTTGIAYALKHETDQHPARLAEIARLCGLDPS